MAGSSHTFQVLCACLRQDPPLAPDWIALIALANHTLTTPALINFVRSHRASVPENVAGYIEELHGRNAIRNDRLGYQLEEAVIALNNAGIVPILFKGAAILATSAASNRAQRMMSDLDIVVSPGDVRTAMGALAAIGYSIDQLSGDRATKWFADLKRPMDVGMIDLHDAFPTMPLIDQWSDELRSHLQPVRFGAADVLVPSRELQALLLLLHDQFQDYDYWTGSIDLRHLLDLKAIVTGSGSIQWSVLMRMAPSALVRNALEAQILLLTKLFGVSWPDGHKKRWLPKLQVWRQLMQIRHPSIRYLLLPMGLLDLYSHRTRPASPASEYKMPGSARKRLFPSIGTLVFLISLSRRSRAGKL